MCSSAAANRFAPSYPIWLTIKHQQNNRESVHNIALITTRIHWCTLVGLLLSVAGEGREGNDANLHCASHYITAAVHLLQRLYTPYKGGDGRETGMTDQCQSALCTVPAENSLIITSTNNKGRGKIRTQHHLQTHCTTHHNCHAAKELCTSYFGEKGKVSKD